jgi:ferritin-like metal-binding protein YciE
MLGWIIAVAQRVEHYEMAGYGTVQTCAKLSALAPIALKVTKSSSKSTVFPFPY